MADSVLIFGINVYWLTVDNVIKLEIRSKILFL